MNTSHICLSIYLCVYIYEYIIIYFILSYHIYYRSYSILGSSLIEPNLISFVALGLLVVAYWVCWPIGPISIAFVALGLLVLRLASTFLSNQPNWSILKHLSKFASLSLRVVLKSLLNSV